MNSCASKFYEKYSECLAEIFRVFQILDSSLTADMQCIWGQVIFE